MAKNSLRNFVLESAQSMGASITSQPTNIQFLDIISFSLLWTGTPVGTFSVEVSSNFDENLQTGTWHPLALDSVPTAVGSGDKAGINIGPIGFPWIRLVYTRTSGTGSLTASISAKAI